MFRTDLQFPSPDNCHENNLSAVIGSDGKSGKVAFLAAAQEAARPVTPFGLLSAATNSMSDTDHISNGRSAAAERMRLYRQRRRQGLRCVRIPLHVTEVDDLIRMGILKEEQRQDPKALRAAVVRVFRNALEENRW